MRALTRKLGILCLAGAAVLALSVLPGSSALHGIVLDRTPSATLVADPIAAIGLDGLADGLYVISDAYALTGSLTNQFAQTLALTLTADPDVTEACRNVTPQGKCTEGNWTLTLCLASSTAAADTTTCTNGTELTFTGSGAANPAAQSFGAVSAAPGQTHYLLTRVTIASSNQTRRLCGSTQVTLSGSGPGGLAVVFGHSPEVPRRAYLQLGSGC